jgi:hypothetical protein
MLGALSGLAGIMAPALAWSQAAPSQPPSPETMQQMRQELEALRAEEATARAAEQARAQRIDSLARQLGMETAAPPIQTIPAAGGQGSTERPANRPSVEIYGFAQLDYIQDFKRVNQNWDATLRPSRIPTTKGAFGSDGQSILSARQSRFGVQAGWDIAGQPFKVKIEFDMYGTGVDEGQTTFRLRHAFGSWGPILAGQTNTNWMDIDTFPNVVDYWGPNGMVFLRTPQIRYTWKRGPHEFAVAIEHANDDIDPGAIRLFDPDLGSAIRNDEKMPDFTAHYRYDGGWGHAQIGGILRRVGFDTPGTADNEPKGHKTGWGVNLSSSLKTWGKDKLQLSAVYGEGIATYLNDGGTDLGPKARLVLPPGAATPVLAFAPDVLPLFGLMVYYDHYWNDHWSSSVGYSQTRVDNLNFQAPDAYRLGQYASANLLYTPDPHLLFGAEFLWGERKDKNGAIGDDTRLQFTAKYSFNSSDLLP